MTAPRLLALAGSTRADSFNQRLLDFAATAGREAGAEVTSVRLRDFDLPLYDGDLEASAFPARADELRALFIEHDGFLISTPEYNGSVSGVLKNAIDWASRPPEQPFDGKPIGLMGASVGTLGSGRAQYHLRQCFVFLNGLVMNRPEVMIPAAQSKFDADGKLTDQPTRDFISAHLTAFKAWVLRMK
jgi:chromate reductase